MGKVFMTLKEIEGVIVHDVYLKKEVERRAFVFEFLKDISGAVDFVAGELLSPPPIRCTWAVKKVFFPEVECYFLYNHKDDELPASMQVLFAGERVKQLKGDDLASLAITTINHMIRFIRHSNPGVALPEICDII